MVYQLAKQMLNHRSGTLFEDMYWIDSDACEVIASETNATEEERIDYSKRTIQAIQQSGSILTIHTHPNSHPPSIQDFEFFRKYAVLKNLKIVSSSQIRPQHQ